MDQNSMKNIQEIFILAGEPSGDKIGADLLSKLNTSGKFIFTGVGGQKMQQEGVKSIYPMSNLSVMGIIDVLFSLPLLLFRNWQTARYIIKKKPDLIILIDSQVFSSMLAKRLRKAGYKNPIILYVAPSVWAWKPERAKNLVGVFDEILAILPFEPKVMKKLDGPKTTFVGHPALIENNNQSPKSKGLIALFPGSRAGEIKRHLPLFEYVAKDLKNHPKVTGFVMPTLAHLEQDLRKKTANWDTEIKIIVETEQREEALQDTILSIVTAGTITLEQALMNINMLCTYVPDAFMHKQYIKANKPLVALPNIILKSEIVPEIYPAGAQGQQVIKEAIKMLDNDAIRQKQSLAFEEMRGLLENGEDDTPRQDPKDRVLAYLS